jgi:hypothetical protein
MLHYNITPLKKGRWYRPMWGCCRLIPDNFFHFKKMVLKDFDLKILILFTFLFIFMFIYIKINIPFHPNFPESCNVQKKITCLLPSIFVLMLAFSVSGGAKIEVIVGGASFTRAGGAHAASAGLELAPHDAVITGQSSRMRIVVGSGRVFVNEGALFRIMPPSGDGENFAIAVERGQFYFGSRQGDGAVTCRFGDMVIIMNDADAALKIDASGRLAEFFVLNGSALIRRGNVEKRITSCRGATLDAAGISEDEKMGERRGEIMRQLEGWVGKTAVTRAGASGQCMPAPAAAAEPSPAPAPQQPPAAPAATAATARQPAPAPVAQATPAPAVDEKEEEFVPPADPTRVHGVAIERITGPGKVHVSEEFTLKCGLTGAGAVTGYVWRFQNGNDVFEQRTDEPQITATVGKTGEFTITCEVLGEGGAVAASQQIKIQAVPNQVMISAGGPYGGNPGTSVKLLGNAKSRFGSIASYEWYLTSGETPDFTSPENVTVQYNFSEVGYYRAIFMVRLADGSVATDTAIINITGVLPTVNAGQDIVSAPGRRVRLNGTGHSLHGEIVKYEWDFDGKGTFEWSSTESGRVDRVFRTYSHPVFRVTDSEGNTATDTMRVVICPKGMVAVSGGGAYCIDKYEWPNQRGKLPVTNITWHEAVAACESVGKRLCTVDEWERACRNNSDLKPEDGRQYPYGDEFDIVRCNMLDNPRSRNAPSKAGAFRDCAGSLSIFDMSGNVSEWVASSDAAQALAYGGFYLSGPDDSACGASLPLEKDTKYLYVGFRCCR